MEEISEAQPATNAERDKGELVYRLSNPGYTIYHRAALGGLAATLRTWQEDDTTPAGIKAELKSDSVRLAWGDGITPQEALRLILDASFKLTPDKSIGGKLIDLPGHGIKSDGDGLRLAIHTGILGTFLQHNKMRPGEKEPRRMSLKSVDEDEGDIFTYKAVDSYAHQKAQGTGLFERKLKGVLPHVATIPQSVIPGAMNGATGLEASAEDAILLLYLMVGCAIYLLHPRVHKEKARYCIVVPDVIDLVAFADEIQRLAATDKEMKRFKANYLNRVVGGAEEAALSFLVDMKARDMTDEDAGIAGCVAIAMGKVTWDANQINRSMIFKLGGEYKELNVFIAAKQHLGKPRTIKLKTGESFAVPSNPVPELIAANLVAGKHWCAHFSQLVSDKQDFQQMSFARKGLIEMKEAVTDLDDQALINTFHDAWRLTMIGLYERDEEREADPKRALEVRRERIRNEILRAKNSKLLANWFLQFCANATRYGPLKVSSEEMNRVRRVIFDERSFDRFQSLCLFALISYGGKEKIKGDNK